MKLSNFSLFWLLFIIFWNLFRWPLIDLLTPFLMPFFEIIIYGIFLVIFIYSVVYLLKNKRPFPIILNLITIVLIFSLPMLVIKWDFNRKLMEREEIISMIETGDLSSLSGSITLPNKYKKLSLGGGEIKVEKIDDKINIFFFMNRGITDNFSGFMYKSGAGNPVIDQFNGDLGISGGEFKKIKDHWFWVNST